MKNSASETGNGLGRTVFIFVWLEGAAVTLREGEFTLSLCVDSTIGTDGFRISGDEKGAVIAGSCPRAVVYGLGKYLHSSGYSAEGFHPTRWQGTSVPTSPFRAIQMDTHFCNFYHMAPAHELSEYVEDIILWGINYIEFVFPLIDLRSWDDPEVEKITGQIRTLYVTAKALGVKVGMEIVPNQDFVDQNMDIRAKECVGRPGGKIARVGADLDEACQACELLRGVDEKLDMWAKKAWRWRILVIRAELDLLRYTCTLEKADTLTQQTNWTQALKCCEEAKPFMTELTQIVHTNLDYDNATHPHYHYVRPQIMDI